MSSSENQPGLQLPAPVVEQAPAGSGQANEQAPTVAEQAPAAPERAPLTGQAIAASAPSMPAPAVPLPPTSDVSATTQSATPAVADDSDLIEKEWVNRAKKIVEATRDDPYKQSEELTVVKADYLQKRYSKTIKVK